jgi:hypothetical protein
MNPLDEALVHRVFAAMVVARPGLARYLGAAEEGDGEGEDVRVLADQVIRGFPWPIGVELRRLFSGSMRGLDRGRLDQLFKAIERTMQLLAFILTAQLLEEVVAGRARVPEAFAAEFRRRFGVLTMGNFAWLVRAVGTLFHEQGIEPFAAELGGVLGRPFYQLLDFWVPERNEIGHYQINLTDEEIERRCVEYGERLADILERLGFLAAYRLVTVREIRVIKPKRQQARFAHAIDLLNSSDSDFATREENQEAFSDSHSVLLMKDLRNPREFLNLSPLVIDTRTEVLDAREKLGLRKDIFLFSKVVGGKLGYVGTEVTERCDLSPLSSYGRLQAEVEELLTVLGSAAA